MIPSSLIKEVLLFFIWWWIKTLADRITKNNSWSTQPETKWCKLMPREHDREGIGKYKCWEISRKAVKKILNLVMTQLQLLTDSSCGFSHLLGKKCQSGIDDRVTLAAKPMPTDRLWEMEGHWLLICNNRWPHMS